MPTKDPNEPKPLDRKKLRFCTEFRKYRDIDKAAEKAGIPKSQAKKVFNLPEVQDEIERQEEAVREERARQQVALENLSTTLLERELVRCILLDPLKQGSLKLEAIRLGLVATGRIQAGNTKLLDGLGGDGAATGGAPNFYQAVLSVQAVPAPIVPTEGAPPPMPLVPASQEVIQERVRALTTPPADPAKRRAGSIKIG